MRSVAAILFAAALSPSVLSVSAATARQEKMKTCNADAGKQQLKGDARKAFMKSRPGASAGGRALTAAVTAAAGRN